MSGGTFGRARARPLANNREATTLSIAGWWLAPCGLLGNKSDFIASDWHMLMAEVHASLLILSPCYTSPDFRRGIPIDTHLRVYIFIEASSTRLCSTWETRKLYYYACKLISCSFPSSLGSCDSGVKVFAPTPSELHAASFLSIWAEFWDPVEKRGFSSLNCFGPLVRLNTLIFYTKSLRFREKRDKSF